ncbi:hypothetical protein ACTA71_011830 [Dictyostelium dimigraforme]
MTHHFRWSNIALGILSSSSFFREVLFERKSNTAFFSQTNSSWLLFISKLKQHKHHQIIQFILLVVGNWRTNRAVKLNDENYPVWKVYLEFSRINYSYTTIKDQCWETLVAENYLKLEAEHEELLKKFKKQVELDNERCKFNEASKIINAKQNLLKESDGHITQLKIIKAEVKIMELEEVGGKGYIRNLENENRKYNVQLEVEGSDLKMPANKGEKEAEEKDNINCKD